MVLRCVIVDDNASFLAAAAGLLEAEGLSVAGAASSAADAVEVVQRLTPDVVLVDVSLGPDSGVDLAHELAALAGRPPVILISTYAESDLVELIDDAPVVGFLPKAQLSAAAVHQIVSGRPDK